MRNRRSGRGVATGCALIPIPTDLETPCEVREPRLDRPARVACLPGHDELRRPQPPRLGARRGRGRAHRQGRGRRGDHLLRHRGHLRGRRERGGDRSPAGEDVPPRRRGGGHQGVHVDGAWREQRRAVPQAHPVRHRRVAAAAGHGLRRPVPDPPLGLPDADRGDHGGAARRRARGQGQVHRRQLDVRVAVRQGAARGRDPRLDQVRVHAEPLQPDLPRGRAGDDPAVRRPGRRR